MINSKTLYAQRSLVALLQILTVVIGVGALVFLLWEPHLEGRNIDATVFDIYFRDPFLAYAYLTSIVFFVALYQIFRVLGLVRENRVYTPRFIKALKVIKYCAVSLVGFIIAAEVYIFIAVRGKDDIAGGVAMGLFMIIVSMIVATTAGMFEKHVQRVADIKSEKDLVA